ncbi:MAG: hypothetical protein LUC93_12620 [Planctomycetaceae bacterium]|nr:hypothetical protein [Planctomycetaceae bacterium]
MINKTACVASYSGGENRSVFPIPFQFQEPGHIHARIRDGAGRDTVLTVGIDYAVVKLTDASGELTLLGRVLPSGCSLTISRRLPLTQEILFHNQGPNSPQAMEEAVDKLTMITQQLQADMEEAAAETMATTAAEIAQIRGETAAVQQALNATAPKLHQHQSADVTDFAVRLAGKAEQGHEHAMSDVTGLVGQLSTKAEKGHRHSASEVDSLPSLLSAKADVAHSHHIGTIAGLEDGLSAKANRFHTHAWDDVDGLDAGLAGKAAVSHRHAPTEVEGLASLLDAKLDADDPRLNNATAGPHAASHAKDGEDPLTPEAIGALPAPPGNGKTYLASGGGWVEYLPPSGGEEPGEGVGTMDHAQLLNRDAADQHPQAAIQNLTRDLGAIQASLNALADVDTALSSSIADKADRASLPGLANATADGLLAKEDKTKLDSLPTRIAALPAGGDDGDALVKGGNGLAWRGVAERANTLPLMAPYQKGVARLSEGMGLELDGGGALRVSDDNLVSKANLEGRFSALDGKVVSAEHRLDGLDTTVGGYDTRLGNHESRIGAAETGLSGHESRLGGHDTRLGSLDTAVGALNGVVSGLGALSRTADAPRDGKPYLRRDEGWHEYVAPSGGGGASAIVGEIRFLPFRKTELPTGWYFCNGDRYSVAGAQGAVLNSLSATMKADWGIAASGGTINLPSLIANGGYFMRAANNADRFPGSAQGDAIRNIVGSFAFSEQIGMVPQGTSIGTGILSGALWTGEATKSYGLYRASLSGGKGSDLHFDASRCVPVADEVRPHNIGMTPAIYLGV